MTTLRRELRNKFLEIVKDETLADTLADTAMDVAGIKRVDPMQNAPLDWQIAAGLSSKEIADHNQRESAEKEKASAFERAMGLGVLEWWSNADLKALLRFLMDKTEDEIRTFAKWSKRQYSSLKPEKARMYPRLVKDCWNLAFEEKEETAWEKHIRQAKEEASKPKDEGVILFTEED